MACIGLYWHPKLPGEAKSLTVARPSGKNGFTDHAYAEAWRNPSQTVATSINQ